MRYHASHSIVCDTPPEQVYDVIRRSRDWPTLLEPCQSVTVLSEEPDGEHIEISALVGGEPMTWQSHRRFHTDLFGVSATVVVPMPLVKAMTTTWRVIGVNATQCVLLLEHDYDLCDDIGGQVEGVTTHDQAERFIGAAIDANSRTELGNLRGAAHRAAAGAAQADGGDAIGLDGFLRHSVVLRADPDTVYGLIRSTDSWPRLFAACVGTSVLERSDDQETVRVEAEQDGRPVAWNTRRRYVDSVRRVEYDLPVPMPFLESMHGVWRVVPLENGRCLLTVDRHWRLLADVRGIRDGISTRSEAAAFVRDFVDGNAAAEMLAIRAFVEENTEALVSLTSRYRLPHSPDRVFALLADIGGWPAMLDHLDSLDVLYDDGAHQEFTMKVRTAPGTAGSAGELECIRSVRHCDERTLSITYFQPQPPPAMLRHAGHWQVRGIAGGSEVISHHTVVLDRDGSAEVSGAHELRRRKTLVADLLERNSRATVDACGRALDRSAGQP
ncbi:aromatase [Parafrankia irregularis]|uniref:Aromatase n=1 Tax=Parafrankia irregularis TaxID=795642 RepID=A0A0S4QUS2_9ACTN|nr:MULTISPECIES: SRPBCC family protein [Parafrankia]MBE3201581.1 SRPBCC family protein [Parafrankia sp. CH37]CUU59344.1 aromatase [Parafrankia irregularis]